MEQAFYDLDAPVARVCSEEVPIPMPKHLEDAALPQPAKVVAAVAGFWARAKAAMIEVALPALGADMEEGKLLEWRVHPGEVVHKGDILAVVDTSKAALDVESWHDGTISELMIEPASDCAGRYLDSAGCSSPARPSSMRKQKCAACARRAGSRRR